MSEMSYIELEAESQCEVQAEAVNLHISLRGASFVTGQAALQQAKEVNRLVQQIKQLGLSESAVRLKGVNARVNSGLLGKSSEAEYQLVIACRELERLAELLTMVSSHEYIHLQQLEWIYPDPGADLLQRAALILTQRARALAKGLDIQLGNLLFCRETSHQINPYPQHQEIPFAAQHVRSKGTVGLDFELKQVRKYSLKVQGRYAVTASNTKSHEMV